VLGAMLGASLRGAWAPVTALALGLALFFDVVTPPPRYVISFDIPSAGAPGTPCAESDATTTLQIISPTTFSLNGRLTTIAALEPRLRARLGNRPGQRVYLQSPSSISYGAFLQVAGLAQSVGFSTVTLGLPDSCGKRDHWMFD